MSSRMLLLAVIPLAVALQVKHPVPVSARILSDHELEELDQMKPQQQAVRLLERAVNDYHGALDQIMKRLDGWRGAITLNQEMETLLVAARNSGDLRVRVASIEIWLAAYRMAKTPEAADNLIREAGASTKDRPWRLWILGMLGGRGVEPERIREALGLYVHDPDEQTRNYAVEGLALLGTDSAIRPLIDALFQDTSPRVRERAACSLAESGMFTRAQRRLALPDLISKTGDSSLDPTTRKWLFQALREITDQKLPEDPAAWQLWWSANSSAK
jgi:HEAT repeats